MPYWTTNWVTIKGDKKEIKALLGDCFDFNEIIPMPETLNITNGAITDEAVRFYETDITSDRYMDLSDEPESKDLSYLWTPIYGICEEPRSRADLKALGRIALENEKKYGFRDWFGWQAENWGTKWGACDVIANETKDGFTYQFNTPWAMPMPIFIKLCRLLHSCEILWQWLDERLLDEEDELECIRYKEGMITDNRGRKEDLRLYI